MNNRYQQGLETRQELEQERDQLRREVEQAKQKLEEFIYLVSHDLKAPLRAINLLVEWLATDHADQLDEEGLKLTMLLAKRAQHMNRMLEGLLLYSRVERVSEETGTIDLNQLLPGLIKQLAPPAHISINVADELPSFQGNPNHVKYLFEHLVKNAIQAMDNTHGEITIACIEDSSHWQFSITDNGSGIEKKHFDRIFQVFQTLHPISELENIGLGLPLAKKIVESNGGQIWVESQVGQGSVFFFTIPK